MDYYTRSLLIQDLEEIIDILKEEEPRAELKIQKIINDLENPTSLINTCCDCDSEEDE